MADFKEGQIIDIRGRSFTIIAVVDAGPNTRRETGAVLHLGLRAKRKARSPRLYMADVFDDGRIGNPADVGRA